MNDHQIWALILSVQAVLLISGLRMLQLVSREVNETIALSKTTLETISRLLQQKQ